jgi:hypothetical protein
MDIYTVREAKPEEQRELTRLHLAPILASASAKMQGAGFIPEAVTVSNGMLATAMGA